MKGTSIFFLSTTARKTALVPLHVTSFSLEKSNQGTMDTNRPFFSSKQPDFSSFEIPWMIIYPAASPGKH